MSPVAHLTGCDFSFALVSPPHTRHQFTAPASYLTTHLNYLTSTSPCIREILTHVGRLERLLGLFRGFCFDLPPPENPTAIYGLSPPCLPTTARTGPRPKELCQTRYLSLLVGSAMRRERRSQGFQTNSELRVSSRNSGCGGLHSQGTAGYQMIRSYAEVECECECEWTAKGNSRTAAIEAREQRLR